MPYWFDGNNLIGQSVTESGARPKTRQAFLSALSRFQRAGGGRFLVYFDGEDPGRSLPPPGIRVRFSAPRSADDAIVFRLREVRHPGEVIVVSNDRALLSRCLAAGAKTMDWPRFHSNMQSRTMQRKRTQNEEQSVDVDDWMDYFGIKQ